jgi:hypothetical protein
MSSRHRGQVTSRTSLKRGFRRLQPVGPELAECMVRRVNAREKFRMKESLRQCIRPLGGEFSPGLDEIRRVPVLRKRAGLVRAV